MKTTKNFQVKQNVGSIDYSLLTSKFFPHPDEQTHPSLIGGEIINAPEL